MTNEDGTLWLAYNGEIYNFCELRAALTRAGHRFRTRTDAEVVLHAYEDADGRPEELLRRFRGMFAFALFDLKRNRLLLARDRLGVKPLYVANVPGNGLAFASEARALARAGLVSGSPELAAVAAYAAWGVVPRPYTIFAGVHPLPPGHFLTWDGNGKHIERWWRPAEAKRPEIKSRGEAAEIMSEALRDAVTRHLVADRPLGVFLSGGLDSGAVTALAVRSAGRVRTLTVTFPNVAGTDEADAAAQRAAAWATDHVEVPVTGSEVAEMFPLILRAMDQPTLDAINTYFVCRAAREQGLVVNLSGLGGDEVFGGYETFRMVPRLARVGRILQLVPAALRSRGALLCGRLSPGGRWARVLDVRPGMPGAYAGVRALFAAVELRRLVPIGSAPEDLGEFLREVTPDVRGRLGVGALEMIRYLPDQLLRDTDSVSMAQSLEVRVPLLDDRVVDVALSMAPEIRFEPGKALLARAVGLPVQRIKKPFTLPFEAWMRGPLRDIVRQALLSDDLAFANVLNSRELRRLWRAFEERRTHWSRPWALTVLRTWPTANGFQW